MMLQHDGVDAHAGGRRKLEPDPQLHAVILAAAAEVVRNEGVQALSIARVLSRTQLGTRAFYRHFESKDQLLCALYRREAEDAAARLNAKVDAAPSPRAALDAWIDEILSLGQRRAKAARVRVLGSPGAMRAEGYEEETRHASKLLMAPLEALLAAGAADGSFPLADPAADASLIRSVVWSAAGLTPWREPSASRSELARQVRSFCARSLGATALR
jgi:AcrR family transcriptional regulator